MRRTLLSLVAAMILAAGAPARADEPADSIQSVIQRQIAAFVANDLEGAFAFASPAIQRLFGNPANFGRMVETGYPMVWRPSHYEMRELRETGNGLIQTVLFEDAAGRLHEAEYLMQEVDGQWRINGVWIRQLPGVGT